MKQLNSGNDKVSKRVKLHIGYISDLPAADCKYHVCCYNGFMKIPKYADLPVGNIDENAMSKVIGLMEKNRSKIWNSIELHSKYAEFGGTCNRREMFLNLTDCMNKECLVMTTQ